MKILVIASTLVFSLGGVAASASAEPARAATSAAAVVGTSAAASQESPETRRYCVVNTPTGSRISRKECNTRTEWLKQGFDPLAAE